MYPLRLTDLDVGFDPRAHGMPVRIPARTASVVYTDPKTRATVTVTGSRQQIITALKRAGYQIAD